MPTPKYDDRCYVVVVNNQRFFASFDKEECTKVANGVNKLNRHESAVSVSHLVRGTCTTDPNQLYWKCYWQKGRMAWEATPLLLGKDYSEVREYVYRARDNEKIAYVCAPSALHAIELSIVATSFPNLPILNTQPVQDVDVGVEPGIPYPAPPQPRRRLADILRDANPEVQHIAEMPGRDDDEEDDNDE